MKGDSETGSADVGIRVMLEALRDIALDPDARLEHTPRGVILHLDTPEARLSIIANALGHIIDHLRDRADA